MNRNLIEQRKWFIASVGLLSLLASTACLLVVRSALPESAVGAETALALMFIGAVSGFARLLTLFIPLLILKLWPGIEGPPSAE